MFRTDDTIWLDKIPQFPPRELVKPGEKWIKHVHCEGARFHVLRFYGVQKPFGKMECVVNCSEPDCIVNKPEDK